MSHRLPLAAAVAALALAAPSAAGASITLSNVVAKPVATGAACNSATDAPAGGHRDLCVAFDVGPSDDDLRDLAVHLAPGLLGDPSATPKCSQADFDADTCPADTQVGEVSNDVVVGGLVPLTLTGKVFNVQPSPTEPARLGLSIPVPLSTPIHLQTLIRTNLINYGLDTTTNGIPNTALGLPVHINHLELRLWGENAAGRSLAKPFVTLPTSCAPATTKINVVSHQSTTAAAEATFTPTGCDQVPFTPGLDTTPASSPADTPGEASATLLVPDGDTGGRRQAHVRTVKLILPEGLTLSPGLANGLVPCTAEQFGQFVDAPPQCPAASKIGSVVFDTPLVGELHGDVYFGQPEPGQKLRNFVSVEDPRLRVKLIGIVTANPVTGQVTNTFDDSPQVPFTAFKFTYFGGPNAVLNSPTTCGTFTARAQMTPWSGTAPQTPEHSGEVVNCLNAFAPTLGASTSTTVAGADTALTVHIERPDRHLRLKSAAISLPPGLAGRLGAVPMCPVDQARAASCPESARVGSATVAVGSGPAPLVLPGQVYLTNGFDGSVAGMAIVVRALVANGKLDFGTVVSLAKINVRSSDAGLDVVTEDLPQIVDGIPTPYRTIDLTIDRPGFMLNPTSCAPLPVHGSFTAVGGEQATSDTTYQASGCDRQPYAPKLSATIGAAGQTAEGSHPPLTTVVTQAPGEANSRHVEVTLPAGLGADPQALARACPAEQLAANACPQSAVVGSVRADTPLLPAPLQGPVLIVKPQGGLLPELALDLHGPISLRLRATVGFGPGGRLKTVFDGIPDVPLSRLALTFTGGKTGIVTAGRNLCGSSALKLDASFESHGGAKRTSTVSAQVPCGAASSNGLKATATLTGVKRKRPALRLKISAPVRFRELRVTLPKQLRGRARLAQAAKLLVGGKGVRKPSLRAKGRTLIVKLPKAGTRSSDLRLARGALRLAGKLKVGQRVTFTVTAIRTNGKKLSVRASARARA